MGLDTLLKDWVPLLTTIENSLAQQKKSSEAKLRGVLKKMKDPKFLAACCYYLLVLKTLSKLSLTFQRENILPFEVLPEVEKTKGDLQELFETTPNLKEILLTSGFSYDEENQTVQQQIQKSGQIRKKEVEETEVTYTKMTSFRGADNSISVLKKILPDVQQCLDTRFKSFTGDFFEHIKWLDPANWGDTSKEVESLQYIRNTFNIKEAGPAGVRKEWRDLKQTVNFYYKSFSADKMWKQMLTYRKKDFPTVVMIVETVLCIGVSNAVVESGFSHLTAMLSDRRLRLNHSTMEDLLLLKVNKFHSDELEGILAKSVDFFMTEKRRKLQMDKTGLSLLEHVAAKRKLARDDDVQDEVTCISDEDVSCISDEDDDEEISESDASDDSDSDLDEDALLQALEDFE